MIKKQQINNKMFFHSYHTALSQTLISMSLLERFNAPKKIQFPHYVLLGHIFREIEKPKIALQLLEKANEIEQNDPNVIIGIGLCYYDLVYSFFLSVYYFNYLYFPYLFILFYSLF